MQICPSVPPNSGAELQCPRATQPGQFWEQLESAARDKQMMPFFSWQKDFFRFISYTASCIQLITPVSQHPPPPTMSCPCGEAVTHSSAPPPSTVAEHLWQLPAGGSRLVPGDPALALELQLLWVSGGFSASRALQLQGLLQA